VRYYGCPAEEGGAAKVFMVRAGHFDDVDIAITWHPAAINRVDDAVSLANTRIDFSFKGRASHAGPAASAPRAQRARCRGADGTLASTTCASICHPMRAFITP
jgi:aminobenzoyl-glutamate utilization protein B